MKKLFFAAIFLFAACSQEQALNLDQSVNAVTFDVTERYHELYDVSFEIVDVHFDFDYFQAALPKDLYNRVNARRQAKEYQTLDDLVECIYYWDKYDAAGDVLCEWPAWDDFKMLIKGTKYEKKFSHD